MNHHQTPSSLLYFVFIIFLVALCGAGYSAYSLLSNPASYAENAWQTRNQPEPTTDTTTVAVENPTTTTEIVTPEPTVVTPTTTTPDTAATLPDALRDMAKRGVQLKQGDKGADVGTVQKFMNQYYKTKNPIDNDYGPGLTTQVTKFQTAQKLPAIGKVGPKTIEAMIKFAK